MPEPSERLSGAGYTRDSVDAYLRAAAADRRRIEQAIVEAHARTDLAERRAKWLDELTPPRSDTEDTPAFGIVDERPSGQTDSRSLEFETPSTPFGSPPQFAFE
jgi:hypothetical protein